MPVKRTLSKKIKTKKVTSVRRVNSAKKPLASKKVLFFSLLLLIGLLITVVASQQQQISTQYAQTSPTTTINPSSGTPTTFSSTTPVFTLAPTGVTFSPPTVTPTFGCLGTSCVGTIGPTIIVITTTPLPTTTPGVTVILPTNPNGKTPPGFFVSLAHRVANWFSKFIRFGGNPPGNPNIPGTGINPLTVGTSSGATTVITIGAGRGKNNATIIYPNGQSKPATGAGTVISPTPPPANPLQAFLNLFTQLFQTGNGQPKN